LGTISLVLGFLGINQLDQEHFYPFSGKLGLKRDHCVCEFFYVFKEPQNLISYNLKKLKDGGLIESYYRSNHKIYKVMTEAEPALKKIVGDIVR